VIAAAGRLGGYGGNLELKRALLRAEGIVVTGSRIKQFEEKRWGPRRQPKPRSRYGNVTAAKGRLT
jgi:hypothetical protein